ncbi:arsenate reductase ArsC [Spirosoma validum]|uniref:Arsenate reductase ArsC n=1 Tax=Spirosoma validum TaxID=2771355 RepID=A0A927GCU0_9BACT|nr:arsenate reductase ArsC [Spirosoma validum]MBD2752846.1 arsenate reductase ArsC [Spirosoma validum]
MKRILVLCTGNSTRSQMAHGYLQKFAGDRADVLSAGVETHGLNPKAVQIMAEDGIDISHHTSNLADEYAHLPIDYVITVCDHASERCPVWTGKTNRIHQNFSDPSKAGGDPDLILALYREVRNEIREFSREFVEKELT